MNNKLEIIYGPMFSGKTTKLIHLYNEKVKEFGQDKCITFNYALDKRYSSESEIVSHDGLRINCELLFDIRDFIDNPNNNARLKNINYIFINEAQFFPDLLNIILFITNVLNKNVILCGLDLDFKKNKFGEILDLIPFSNKIHKMTGKCNTKNCNKPSIYSYLTIKYNSQLLIGNDVYIPLCEDCYNLKEIK
jgi:thymidine kinase